MGELSVFLVMAAGLVGFVGMWHLLPRDVDDRLSTSPLLGYRSPGSMSVGVSRLGARLGGELEQRLSPRRLHGIEQRLTAAGVLGRQAVRDHLNRRALVIAVSAVASVVLGLLLRSFVLFLIVVPAVWLNSERRLNAAVRRRAQRIESELPDFLDVAAVMLSAGLSFKEVLRRVSEAMPGPVAVEIGYVLRQLDLGVPMRDALGELRGRNESEAFDKFVAALLQADQLGSPLSSTMINLAGDIRRGAAQAARRRASQTAPRVSLVLTTFIVPASLALLLAALVLGSEVDFGEIFGA